MMKHSIPSVFSDSICDSSRDNGDIVIVGNGIAGITAALEVCRLSPEKHVVVITEQNHPTIYTPALKQFAIGKLAREQLLAHPAGTERANHIHMINARVEEIKAHRKCVYLSNGRTFGYGSLLLATGSSPAGLAPTLPGHDFDGVLTLHRLHDYLDLRRRLHEVKEAVVIGGGIHAIETVMSLHNRHIRVHWLIRSEAFCPHMLDCEASDMVLEDCRRAGVSVRTGVEIVGIVGRVGAVAGVVTSDEQFLPCQLVIACTGSRPVTTLATYCDVPLEQLNGILVDDHLRTSAENIFAAGDCTALENPQTGAYQSRMQWHAAALQGRIAAAMMTGHTDSVSSMGVPWHTTQAGSLPMLSVGNPLNIPGATFLTDRNKRSYRRLAFYDNRLIGYLALGGRLPDSFAIKRLIDEGHSVRGIEKDLLIGEFDEHRYFSQPKPQTIHPKVHTEELPTFQLPLVPKVSHTTEPLMPAIDISSRRKVIKKPDESVDDVCLQKESGEIKYKFSEIIANKDKRGVYSHARDCASWTKRAYHASRRD